MGDREVAVDAVPVPARSPGTPYSVPLPVPPTAMLGREREVAELTQALVNSEWRLVVLTGPGGVGKTRLALAVAARLSTRLAGGVAFADLTPLRDAALVPATIALALGLHEISETHLVAGLLARLAGKELLLLVDNFEHVAIAAPWLADVVAASPALRVLATSRVALRVRNEREFPVAPLRLPAQSACGSGEDLVRNPAVNLFVQRAQAVRPDFSVTLAEANGIAAIVRHLDGLPLAIELAAARSKVLPPSALLARLDHRLAVLVGGPPPRRRGEAARCHRRSTVPRRTVGARAGSASAAPGAGCGRFRAGMGGGGRDDAGPGVPLWPVR